MSQKIQYVNLLTKQTYIKYGHCVVVVLISSKEGGKQKCEWAMVRQREKGEGRRQCVSSLLLKWKMNDLLK